MSFNYVKSVSASKLKQSLLIFILKSRLNCLWFWQLQSTILPLLVKRKKIQTKKQINEKPTQIWLVLRAQNCLLCKLRPTCTVCHFSQVLTNIKGWQEESQSCVGDIAEMCWSSGCLIYAFFICCFWLPIFMLISDYRFSSRFFVFSQPCNTELTANSNCFHKVLKRGWKKKKKKSPPVWFLRFFVQRIIKQPNKCIKILKRADRVCGSFELILSEVPLEENFTSSAVDVKVLWSLAITLNHIRQWLLPIKKQNCLQPHIHSRMGVGGGGGGGLWWSSGWGAGGGGGDINGEWRIWSRPPMPFP